MGYTGPVTVADVSGAGKRRPWWRRLPGMVLLLATGGVLGVSWLLRDGPPPEVSDLVLVRPTPPPEANAFGLFERAAKGRNLSGAESSRVRDYLRDRPGDDAPLATALERNAIPLSLVREGLARPACVSRGQPKLSRIGPWYDLFSLSELMRVDAKRCRLAGKRGESLDSALAQVRFGTLLCAEPEGVRQWQLGSGVLRGGLEACEALVRDNAATATELEAIDRELRRLPSPVPSLTQAVKSEYWRMDDLIRSIERGECNFRDIFGDRPEYVDIEAVVAGCLFAPNRSRTRMADLCRLSLRHLGGSLAEFRKSTPPGAKPQEGWADQLRSGVGFDRVIDQLACYPIRVVTSKCALECSIAGTRLLVAIRRFELREGHLPGRLADLVPADLEAVPQDPYDGAPFRYLPELEVVYSVGEDRIDRLGKGSPRRPKTTFDSHKPSAPDPAFWLRADAAAP